MTNPLYSELLARLQAAPGFGEAMLEAALRAHGATAEADAGALLAAVADLYTAERERTRQITHLYQLSRSIGVSLELDDVLQEICTAAAKLLDVPFATIFNLDREGGVLVARTAFGLPPTALSILNLRLGEGVVGQVAVSGHPVVIDDTQASSEAAHQLAGPLNARAIIVVPILRRDEVIGVLTAASPRPHAFGPEAIRLLELLTYQADHAIENAQLHRHARELAAQEERQRLARDLHDSVTQSLFSLNLISQVLPDIWQSHPDKAWDAIHQMANLSSDALAEMRALLFQLRPVALDQMGLAEAIRRYVDAMQRRGYPLQLEVADNLTATEQPPLLVQEAIYRIAQEAINNASRHARARQITVSLSLDPHRASLMVSDDGVGFDLANSRRPGHLGLGNMHERAAQVGGHLYIVSVPGEGTAVRLEIGL